MAAAQAGEAWALSHVFGSFGPPVAAYLRAQGVEDPDDLSNEVFHRAFRRIGGFSGTEEKLRSWIFAIAHNLLIDERRRSSRRVSTTPLAEVTGIDAGDVEADAGVRLDEQAIRQLLDTLTAEQRDVLLLRILGDVTVEQVAQVLRKRAGAVKALQRRGLVALRRQLDGVPL